MKSILDLPDDILIDLFSRYVSTNDLFNLERVCGRFRHVLHPNSLPWLKKFRARTNITFSRFKNAVGCPAFENVQRANCTVSHQCHVPDEYEYEIILDRSTTYPSLLCGDQRRPFERSTSCAKHKCDIHRLRYNYRQLTRLAGRWTRPNGYRDETLIKFTRRAQTSLIYYDEHDRQLWFTQDHALRCLDLDRNRIVDSWEFIEDDVLSYKVYDDHLLCLANGSGIRIVCRQTHLVHLCQSPQQQPPQIAPSERCDVLSLDVYTNDRQRYLIVSGSRDHTVSMRSFDMFTQSSQSEWRTKVDDRVLCTRFTHDGRHLIIGTGAISNVYPLVLFDTERAQPVHLYNAGYRVGAGVRCIEWISPNVFIAAGFDCQFKEFDLRTGQSHYTFEDEFDNDYCSLAVSADLDEMGNGIVLGGNHHSTVRLVNRRQRAIQHVFFVTSQASPVHSLAVTPEMLFASLDRSIVALDFSGRRSANQRQCLKF